MYLPAIVGGLAITLKHFTNMLLGRTKITMQYPEEKWDSSLPDHYRGAPALVRDSDGRALRCLSAMRIHLSAARDQNYSRRDSFDRPVRQSRKISRGIRYRHDSLHFLRMCEEVCPEQAIFLRKDYAITGFTRADMVHHKEKLLEIGGVMHGVVLKWNEKK